MKKTSRLAALLAAASILLSSCGGSPQKDGTAGAIENVVTDADTEASLRRVLGEWSGYLNVQDYVCGDMLWVISYVEEFLKDPGIDSLAYARTALSSAEMYIEKRDMPERTVTDEDYAALTEAGFGDVIVVKTADVASTKEYALSCCTTLKGYLYDGIYSKSQLEIIEKHVDLYRRDFTQTLNYLAVTTEYFMRVLATEAVEADFRAFLEENLPGVNSRLTDEHKKTPTAELKAACDALLDETEDIENDMSALLGEMQQLIYEYEDAVLSGDDEYFANDANPVTGLEFCFLTPPWKDVSEMDYLLTYTDEDGNAYPAEEQKEITAVPEKVTITADGVTLEEVREYVLFYAELEIMPDDYIEDTDAIYALYNLDGGYLSILYSEGTAYLTLSPLCYGLAPAWYINHAFPQKPRKSFRLYHQYRYCGALGI